MDAAEPFSLPQDLVFVDLETTGGNAAHHRITEVGIVVMHSGVVVEEWSSLINPQCLIPSYIEGFTGITNEMVAEAPRFADIAHTVLDKLQTAPMRAAPMRAAPIFVAHNARFDYSFLRAEFRRLEMTFSARVICTVKLSRRLYPEYLRHNLDAVMERHRLTCAARHRALGDARVLSDFWSVLRGNMPDERLAAAAHAVLNVNRLPACLPLGLADDLPEGPGVYRLFGEGDVLLYVGKGQSIRSRVLGHFATDGGDAKQQKKAELVRRIDWFETAGDLGSRLKEADWIRTQKPLYNRRLKEKSDGFTFMSDGVSHGVRIAALTDMEPQQIAGCFGVFFSQKDARRALVEIARARALCLKVLGLEHSEGSCLAYQMGQCKGACVGKEPLLLHNLRLQLALSSLKLKAWPFPGRVALREGRDVHHVLDHWMYLGTARSEDELAALVGKEATPAFDIDVYRILVRHLAKNPRLDWRDVRETCA